MKFNTFDEVKNWYERTKPVREKNHGTARDIRPIDERRYKERRIVKIDDNCYVLSDGWHYSGGVANPHDHNSNYKVTTEDMIRFAPIVWRRAADGTETIAVRNAGYGSNTTHSRHVFLRQHLPYGIRLMTGYNNGKHFLRCASGETAFPKATALPQAVYDVLIARKSRWMRGITLTDKATALFQREGKWKASAFYLLSEVVPEPMKRVNKDAKAPYAAAIREFREWALLMLPMLQIGAEGYYAARQNIDKHSHGEFETILREALLDPSHPNRVDLIYVIFRDVVYYPWRDAVPITAEHFQKFKRGLTPWLNKKAGFIKTEPR
jgi:hypothetical protein